MTARWIAGIGSGLLAGFAGLLCAGTALTIVAVVGLVMLARRGWRAAALHTVPLTLAYACGSGPSKTREPHRAWATPTMSSAVPNRRVGS